MYSAHTTYMHKRTMTACLNGKQNRACRQGTRTHIIICGAVPALLFCLFLFLVFGSPQAKKKYPANPSICVSQYIIIHLRLPENCTYRTTQNAVNFFFLPNAKLPPDTLASRSASTRTVRQPPRNMVAPKQRKIAIVGSRAVGKSSLTVQFVDGHFVESYYPTIENTFSKVIRYKNQDFATEIIDTAGQDEYSILNSKHFIGIHGYIIVYSVASKQSFEMARVIRDKILNHLATEFVPLTIVGNKSDLRPEQRQVTAEEGKALAEELKCAWTEASARYDENVQKAFELMIGEVEKSQNPGEPAGGSKCVVM
ncbi:unnamed protein product [Periconia digitata]|uniref:Rheb n=1 Tax=Periconia digitata TaxID=1303443 RepID=A0A9W4UEN3_9PLEO|nr:unnamed protein product [Periconia digitata]